MLREKRGDMARQRKGQGQRLGWGFECRIGFASLKCSALRRPPLSGPCPVETTRPAKTYLGTRWTRMDRKLPVPALV